MRVLVLGGAGWVGGNLSRVLYARGHELTLLDTDKSVRDVAKTIGAEAIVADATRVDVLPRPEGGADLVIDATGPAHRLQAGITAGLVHAADAVVDLCDDLAAAKARLSLHAKALERQARVGIGTGALPGLSNVMAREAASAAGSGASVRIAWAISASAGLGTASVEHQLHEMRSKAAVFSEGVLQDRPPLSEPETVPFPEPVGPVLVRARARPELLTLPKATGAAQVVAKGALVPSWVETLTEALAATPIAASDTAVHALARAGRPLEDFFRTSGPEVSGLRVDAWGPQGHAWAAVCAPFLELVTITAATAADHALQGGLPPGVHAAEAWLPWAPLRDALVKAGAHVEVHAGA